jgi:sugar/nucleoside kinase (ribokinase family)
MRKLGMKVYSGHTERMTCFRNHLTPDGARHQELLAVSESIASTTIRPALNGSMLIHLGPVHPEDIHHDAIRDLTDVPGKVSLDVQGYLRTGYLGNVRASVSESLEKALSRSSFIKADHSEMALILKHFGCNVQDLASRFDIEEIIVTCGSEGGYVVSENGIQVNYDAVQVDKLVDTTGAGDVFFSAYMTERLFRQKSIKQATQFAARRAAMQVSGMFIHSEDLNIGSA